MTCLPRFLLLCGVLFPSFVFSQEPPAFSGSGVEEAAGHSSEHKPAAELGGKWGVSNPEMLEAIDQAQSTLDSFLAFAENPGEGMSGFKLKVILREESAAETFWVIPFRRFEETGKEVFEGTLANTPEVLKNVSLGQSIRFTREDVADWGFVHRGRQIGSFTVCVTFKRMPKQQADYFRKYNGFDC